MINDGVFIAERPTQIITAIQIVEQLGLAGRATIIVADCFRDAGEITRRFSEHFKPISFHLTRSYEAALHLASSYLPADLFIHWDVGVGTQKRLRSLHAKNNSGTIRVFEEGVGTYRRDIYPPLKRIMLSLAGYPVNVGGSKFTDEIMVRNAADYTRAVQKKPPLVTPIKKSLEEYIEERMPALNLIFDEGAAADNIMGSKEAACNVLLSNYKIDERDYKRFKSCDGHRILKTHPYCEQVPAWPGVFIPHSSVPSEIIIMVAAKHFQTVTVYHYGSSSERYVRADNVLFVDIEGSD